MTTTARTRPGSRPLAALFGSEARAAVLGCLFTRPEPELLLRDIARYCGMAVTPVYRQLQKLEEIGLVESRMIGNSRAYRLRETFPGFGALREVVDPFGKLVAALTRALSDFAIEAAFVFGSIATGTATPKSDVDLFIITDDSEIEIAGALMDLQLDPPREINDVVLTPAEFARRMAAPSAFLMNVMRLEKIFVRGDEDTLRRLAEQRCHSDAPAE